MKTLVWIFIALFGVASIAVASSNISPIETQNLLKQGKAVLIDVRERDELSTGTAKGSLWFPFTEIRKNETKWKNFLAKLDKTKKIILYCASGGRAEWVATELKDNGFKTANMGGLSDWIKNSLPISHAMPDQF